MRTLPFLGAILQYTILYYNVFVRMFVTRI